MSATDDHESMREQALATVREAFTAAGADHHVMGLDPGAEQSEPLAIGEFRSFAESIWSAERRVEYLMISEVHRLPAHVQNWFADSAAAARWFTVPNWFDGNDLIGPRLVAYIDVKAEGLRRLVALHEIAHLLVDSETVRCGHGSRWIEAYRSLMRKYLPPGVQAIWDRTFAETSNEVAERVAADPLWLAHLL
ncbi:hypothetical protein [Streptomyces cylindrosporus]|uniref:Uncharacterized protein n=1 Tax=Streptomyces cylindrosporus TaxID=2927583 RepID=A0ABS9YMA5_9ACTN|nr:hypothetical protein [Streptomyces cylindrosporus]MCI3276976.1 hypothetical protein [Streptomyces cylindrosporus]